MLNDPLLRSSNTPRPAENPDRFPSRAWMRSLVMWIGVIIAVGIVGIIAAVRGHETDRWVLAIQLSAELGYVWQAVAIIREYRAFATSKTNYADRADEDPWPTRLFGVSLTWWLGATAVLIGVALWLSMTSERVYSATLIVLGVTTMIAATVTAMMPHANRQSRLRSVAWMLVGLGMVVAAATRTT